MRSPEELKPFKGLKYAREAEEQTKNLGRRYKENNEKKNSDRSTARE